MRDKYILQKIVMSYNHLRLVRYCLISGLASLGSHLNTTVLASRGFSPLWTYISQLQNFSIFCSFLKLLVF